MMKRKFSTQKCYMVIHAVSVVYYLKTTIRAPKIFWKITELWQKKESNQTKTCAELNSVILKQENKWKTHIYRSSAEYNYSTLKNFIFFFSLSHFPVKDFSAGKYEKGSLKSTVCAGEFWPVSFFTVVCVNDSRIFFLVLNRTMNFRCSKRTVKKKAK